MVVTEEWVNERRELAAANAGREIRHDWTAAEAEALEVARLVGALKDSNPLVREFAAELLGRLGASATSTLPALAQCMRTRVQQRNFQLPNCEIWWVIDCSKLIRSAAAVAIDRIAPN